MPPVPRHRVHLLSVLWRSWQDHQPQPFGRCQRHHVFGVLWQSSVALSHVSQFDPARR